ncbi:hypothetical protein RZS08_15480, partial [Arthrospira platensis SPKY1]|nr:hypothetical protein [Arthrospira platensis SPKY1]
SRRRARRRPAFQQGLCPGAIVGRGARRSRRRLRGRHRGRSGRHWWGRGRRGGRDRRSGRRRRLAHHLLALAQRILGPHRSGRGRGLCCCSGRRRGRQHLRRRRRCTGRNLDRDVHRDRSRLRVEQQGEADHPGQHKHRGADQAMARPAPHELDAGHGSA